MRKGYSFANIHHKLNLLTNFLALTMKFLLTSHPGYGHINPLIALGIALLSRGHDVIYATSAVFEKHISNTGIRAISAGAEWTESDVGKHYPEFNKLNFLERSSWMEDLLWNKAPKSMIPDLLKIIEQEDPDLLISNAYDWSGALAAEISGKAHALASIAVKVPGMCFEAIFEENYQSHRKLFGLQEDIDFSRTRRYLELSFMPESWSFPGYHAHANEHFIRPLFYDLKNSDSNFKWNLRFSEKPMVYVSLGTVTNDHSHLFRVIINALAGEDYNVIMTIGENNNPQQFDPLPANVLLAPYIPQSLILPQVDVCICHGGVSTVLASLAEGIPLLVLPLGADQPINASVCQLLNVAPPLPKRLMSGEYSGAESLQVNRVDEDFIRTTLKNILADTSYKVSALRIKNEISALPSLQTAAVLIEELAEKVNIEALKAKGP
ncbi:MAG: UDP:flavonoid glycosyltransferase YjiC (YdhE family) [Flavobacteriales bacterium]|jgi:UDP:flavonoid glycosyltransferase YjiC (YdhE family)